MIYTFTYMIGLDQLQYQLIIPVISLVFRKQIKYHACWSRYLYVLKRIVRRRCSYHITSYQTFLYKYIHRGYTRVNKLLGPLLFIIYMNDLPNASRLFKCIIYADDTTLIANLNDFYAKHDSGLNIIILNDELEKISYWLLVNKLSLNKLKSKFMLFHQPQKRVTIPKLKINNTLIECVDEFNYLGLIINSSP